MFFVHYFVHFFVHFPNQSNQLIGEVRVVEVMGWLFVFRAVEVNQVVGVHWVHWVAWLVRKVVVVVVVVEAVRWFR